MSRAYQRARAWLMGGAWAPRTCEAGSPLGPDPASLAAQLLPPTGEISES
jgi:hypothetical protein